MKNLFKTLLVALAAMVVAQAATAARVVRTIDSGWRFALTADNAASVDFNDKDWQQLNLPHS